MNSDRIWYIKLNRHEEGPYSFEALKLDLRLTPDTLARREGEGEWRPLRDISELEELFKDENREELEEAQEEEIEEEIAQQEEITLQFPREPTYLFLFWLVIVAIIICYILYQLYWNL